MVENWAIVCGAIRSDIEFEITVNAVLKFRNQGLIQGIVVSTWNDSFTDKPALKQELLKRGITVLEVPGLREGGNGQTYRQHRLFEAGLQACPPGSAVLKLRSDKTVHRLSLYVNRLKDGPVAQLPDQSPFQLMKAKISVQGVSVSMPFNHSDLVFYGLREDLLSLIQMDQFYDWACFPGSMNAEIRWFSRPFLRQLRLFRQFFEYFNCRTVSRYLVDNAQAEAPQDLPPFLYDVLAANILCIHYNFDISSPDTGADQLTTTRLLGGADRLSRIVPMTMTQHAVCYSNTVIRHFAEGNFTDDTPGEGLKAALKRLKDPTYRQRPIVAAELKDMHAQFFPDLPLGNSADAVLRMASNLSVPQDISEPHYLDVTFSDGGTANTPEEKAFIETYILENAINTDLAALYFQVARKYTEGTDIKPDETAAHYWLHLSAENRYRPAEKAWADTLKDRGELEDAAQWYRKAALRGDPEAQKALAVLLRDHEIVSVTDDWNDWMARAAEAEQIKELPA